MAAVGSNYASGTTLEYVYIIVSYLCVRGIMYLWKIIVNDNGSYLDVRGIIKCHQLYNWRQ